MIFGKIDYINLLPFHLFLKRSSLGNSFKKSAEYKKSFPTQINKKFKHKIVNGAFISSIETDKRLFKTISLGIVAKKNVSSVLVKIDRPDKEDVHSATSNILAKVLRVKGEVLIGDNALRCYLDNPDGYIDLAEVWHKRYGLPFVFAVLSANSHFKTYKKLSDRFKKNRIKIPQYILKKYAYQRKISQKDILKYLSLISYEIGVKERRGLKLFLKKAKSLK